jgi:hypothetical protein
MAEQRVIPMFSYEDVGRAADWIAEAFGFTETGRWSDDEGRARTTRARSITPRHASRRAPGARRRTSSTACTSRSTTSMGLRTRGCSRGDDPVGAGGKHGNRAAAIPSRGSRRSPLDVRDASLVDTSRCRTPAVRVVAHGTGRGAMRLRPAGGPVRKTHGLVSDTVTRV